ncbi:barstar family protein [Anatilimnocola sp. NA78]|uniref:barstar family protein n=1 Tax=Anatilimnocola sp. NA78 TaxID=3415683 RepID=UPI003CE47006
MTEETEPTSEQLPEVLQVEDPRAYAAEARKNSKNRVLWVPRSVRSKDTLLRLYSDSLHFPRYFRRNWDAFEECLRAFVDKLPEQAALVIVHEHYPFAAGENCTTYLQILNAAANDRTDGRRVEMVFPG